MHRYGDRRLDDLRESRGFVRAHRVGAVADREEGDIGLDGVELRRVIRVAGVVVGPTPELDDVADPPVLFRMRLEPVLHHVVGGHRREAEPAHLVRLARSHRRDVAGQLPRHVMWRHELGRYG